MTKLEIMKKAKRVYELMPKDNHRSFYGRALVVETESGYKYLVSYDTVVMILTPDGQYLRTWDGWSATTGRHMYAFSGLHKREVDKLDYLDI